MPDFMGGTVEPAVTEQYTYDIFTGIKQRSYIVFAHACMFVQLCYRRDQNISGYAFAVERDYAPTGRCETHNSFLRKFIEKEIFAQQRGWNVFTSPAACFSVEIYPLHKYLSCDFSCL
jgi:hypothetical protein